MFIAPRATGRNGAVSYNQKCVAIVHLWLKQVCTDCRMGSFSYHPEGRPLAIVMSFFDEVFSRSYPILKIVEAYSKIPSREINVSSADTFRNL